jgi:glycosyltransferase involved in cell wall biosynthesis
MTIKNNLVSVIIPHYNHGAFIEEAVESVYASNYANIELIIIDDSSSEINSLEKLELIKIKYSEVKIITQTNSGPSVAKNRGAEHAQGQYLFFLDADNIIFPHYISDAVQILEKNTEVAMVYADYECFGEISEIHYSGICQEYMLPIGNSIDNCVLIRKKVFCSIGGFDINLSKLGLEDWELWINLKKNNYHFYYLNKVYFRYRVTSNSRTEVSANPKLEEIKSYIFSKHSLFLLNLYNQLYYQKKQLAETPDYRIGNFLMSPYRLLKKIFL